jgi:hypothetical protein
VLHIAGSPDLRGVDALREMVVSSLASLSDAELTANDMIAGSVSQRTQKALSAPPQAPK